MARIRGTNRTQPGPFRWLAVAAALAVATVTGSAVARQAGPRQWRALGEEARDAETMDASLRRLAAEKGVTALSVAVVDGGRTVYARTVGVVDGKTRRPADERTVFRAASLSSPYSHTW